MSKGRTYIKRCMLGVLVLLMVVSLIPPKGIQAADAGGIVVKSKDGKVPVYKAGESHEWQLTVINNTGEDVKNIIVSPELGDTTDVWPFETEQQDYSCQLEELKAGAQTDISFTFKQRTDVPTARYTLQFAVCADGMDKQVSKLYVNTTAKPSEEKNDKDTTDKKEPEKDTSSGGDEAVAMDEGGFSNGDVSYSGGGYSDSGTSSVPRVIVTGFTTDPAEVRAGSDFTLTIHLKNTSKTSRVQNMLFDLSAPTEGEDQQTTAPAFLPTSGSSSIYLDGIAAGGTADIAIRLNAKSDLLQKPYSIDLAMKYEDGNNAQIEGSSSLSIPVKQDARFELSSFEISPESIEVGDEANVMCNLYNLGRIKLYNVKAVFEGACIEKEEVFVGNVESGATASIDAMLKGKKATNGPAKVTMTLSYEDEAGKVTEKKEEMKLEVTEAMEDEVMMTEPVEESGGLPVVPIVIIVALIAVCVAAGVIIKKKKQKKMENEEEALLDELDRPSEDEQQ